MTVRNPQLFHEVDVDDLWNYVSDPEWALEQKVDGMRCLTVISQTGIEFFTRGGRPLNSSAAKLHFQKIRNAFAGIQQGFANLGMAFEIVIDAEIMPDQGKLVMLDMPYWQVDMLPGLKPWEPFARRRAFLETFAQGFGSEVVVLVQNAVDEDSKAALVREVTAANAEGFIAKRLDAGYDEGVRVKHSLKIKLTKTADVVVMAKNSGESKHSKRGGDKINFEFGVYRDRMNETGEYIEPELVHIGNCSGIGKQDAWPGEVIEVEYLYMGAGGKLVQPRMIRRRDDKKPADCSIEQIPTYSKKVL